MKIRAIIALACLAAAAPGLAGPAGPGGVDEMREWLGRRNQERKAMGLPGADLTLKKHFPGHPKRPAAAAPPPEEEAGPQAQAAPPRGAPVLHIGQGPDGRIRHRLVFKEEGPDQLQALVPDGAAEEAARLERLTPKGRKAWMAGASLRVPRPRWLKPGLDPKAKSGGR